MNKDLLNKKNKPNEPIRFIYNAGKNYSETCPVCYEENSIYEDYPNGEFGNVYEICAACGWEREI